MSLSSLLTQLSNARGALVSALISKGVPVNSSATILSCASAISGIPDAAPATVIDTQVIIHSGYVSSSYTVNTGLENITLGYVTDGKFYPLTFSGTTASNNGDGAALDCYRWRLPWSGSEVSSGGVISGTSVSVSSGYTYVGTEVQNGGMTILDGGRTVDVKLRSVGSMFVSSGGTADETLIDSFGHMVVSSGGTANRTNIFFDGRMTVLNGGLADSTTADGTIHISSGGTVTDVVVNSGGSLAVYSGGTATDVVASNGMHLGIAVAPNTYIQGTSNGSAFVMQNASISGYNVVGGYLDIFSGGTANRITVNSAGVMTVQDGGSVLLADVNYGGKLHVSNGGIIRDTDVNLSGNLIVSSGGTAYLTMVDHGSMIVSSGGTANSTTVNHGNLHISSGGIAKKNLVYGSMYVSGTATSATVGVGGTIHISSGGTVTDVVVNSGGSLAVYSGGTATDVTLSSGGTMVVHSGSFPYNVTSMTDAVIINS